MGRGKRGADLYHARIQIARKGVDIAQGFQLDRKAVTRDRVIIGVELGVCARRRIRHGAAAIAHGQTRRVHSPF